MAPSRNIIIAGAGIGGLTAALALAQRGFRVTLLDQAERLEETGAGIQLSPNATRVLIALGLEQRLRADAVAPDAVDDHDRAGGQHPGAHPARRRRRSALRRALLGRSIAAICRRRCSKRCGPTPTSRCGSARGSRISSCTPTASASPAGSGTQHRGRARHRADLRRRAVVAAAARGSAIRAQPQFRQRTAWRALVPADAVAPDFAHRRGAALARPRTRISSTTR